MLDDALKRVANVLNKNYDYLLIGGIAAGILGEPRMTGDIDICIFLDKKSIKNLLKDLKNGGFRFQPSFVRKNINQFGTFTVHYSEVRVDFVIASTEFERNAFIRRKTIKLFGEEIYLPTPEDLILLKIVPARHIDRTDIIRIIERNKGKLDWNYIEEWAMKLSTDAEDMRIYNEIKELKNEYG